jgi:hypothetical protein
MAIPIPMPLRNERIAPKFDTSRPRELPRYFEDFEELIFRAQITDETEKKKFAVRYTDFETEQQWKSLPEFRNSSSYVEFKAAILFYYPEASDDFAYSLRDLELLIEQYQHSGIATAKHLSEYHLRFMTITTWLIEREHLCELERQRAYIRAFPTQLLAEITKRLQIKDPDHHPNIPYRVSEVYEAARFNLLSLCYSSSFQSLSPSIAIPNTSPSKIEDLAPLVADLAKNLAEAARNFHSPLKSTRIYKSNYQQQPNHFASAPLSHTIDSQILPPRRESQPVRQPSTDDRIAEIEAELAKIRNEQSAIPSNIPNTAQRSQPMYPKYSEVQADFPRENASEPRSTNPTEPTIIPTTIFRAQTFDNHILATTTESISISQPNSISSALPRTVYLPPTEPNFAGLRKRPAISKRSTPSTQPLSPSENNKITADNPFDKIPITVTQRELLSLAPAIRTQVNEDISTPHIQVRSPVTSSDRVRAPAKYFSIIAVFTFSQYSTSISTHTSPPTCAAKLSHYRRHTPMNWVKKRPIPVP